LCHIPEVENINRPLPLCYFFRGRGKLILLLITVAIVYFLNSLFSFDTDANKFLFVPQAKQAKICYNSLVIIVTSILICRLALLLQRYLAKNTTK